MAVFLTKFKYYFKGMRLTKLKEKENYMQISKKTAAAIAILLISLFAVSLFAMPNANAQQTMKSYPFLGAVPNPVGVGQEVLLHVGALTALRSADEGWEGLTVTVEKPNGQTETVPVPKTDSTGGTGVIYVPDEVGTYNLHTNFPEQEYRGVTYLAATSETLVLNVTQEPVQYYPASPLPTEYWTRPIDSQQREWHTISGSWVAQPANLYAPYNEGPTTPHILWTMPVGESMGGLVGGDFGEYSYGIGDAYEGKWSGSVIISGVLYFHQSESGSPNQPVVAVDLHTGEVLWKKTLFDNSRISFAQILDWNCLNYHGAFSYLWISSAIGSGSNRYTVWSAFDTLTGDWRFNITNVPSGTRYYGPNGEILMYSMTNIGNSANPNYRLLQWNMSWVVTQDKTGMSESWGSQVKGRTYNATERPGYDLNASIPSLSTAGNRLPGSILTVFVGDRVIGGSVSTTEVNLWGLSLQRGQEGTLLFNNTWKAPSEWTEGNITVGGFQAGWAAYSQEDLVAVLFTKENRVHYGFSLKTGEFLWESEAQYYLDAWDDSLTPSFGPTNAIAYGKLYSASISGIVYCYNVTTGERLWTYEAVDKYSEFQFTNNWWLRILFITDGKVYAGHLEHSPVDPRPRGAPFLCLNATTGEEIFRADGLFRQTRWGGRAVIGDSVIATMDTYNQQVYGIGKGPSRTTVTAPDIGVPFGSSVVIRGTVTDVSPGTSSFALDARFPNGVPAMSDASQGEWMGYVYKQFLRPTNATGVDVILSVIDANNNYRDIGTATTDASGSFSYQWVPDIPGKYTVIATFAGSGAYYASYAQTAIGVDEAPEPTPVPTPTPVSVAEQYFVPATVGMTVAIIAVGAVLALLLLRKRP